MNRTFGFAIVKSPLHKCNGIFFFTFLNVSFDNFIRNSLRYFKKLFVIFQSEKVKKLWEKLKRVKYFQTLPEEFFEMQNWGWKWSIRVLKRFLGGNFFWKIDIFKLQIFSICRTPRFQALLSIYAAYADNSKMNLVFFHFSYIFFQFF